LIWVYCDADTMQGIRHVAAQTPANRGWAAYLGSIDSISALLSRIP
jgi:hypothetical protein